MQRVWKSGMRMMILILEDNYFDMNAGEYRVKILDGKPDGLKVRSVYDI